MSDLVMPVIDIVRSKLAIPVALLLLATGHVSSCSSSRRSDVADASTIDADVDSDSDADSDNETDTGTETGAATGGWHWEWDDPPWGLHGWLHDVTGRDIDDVVAVMHHDLGDRYILRFDGATWDLDPYETEEILGFGVACLAGNDRFYLGPLGPNPNLLILTSTADTWAAVPPPDLCTEGYQGTGGERYLGCLENGFAVVFSCEIPGPSDDPSYLAGYDGTEWTVVLGPESLSEAGINPYLVWGPATDDLSLIVWGDPTTPGYHFDGESLTPMTAPAWPQCDEQNGSVWSIDGAAEHGHGYYAVGSGVPEGWTELQGFVWHSEDRIHWTEIEVPHPPEPETYREIFFDVWISDEGQVYVVGMRYLYDELMGFPLLLRFDGEEWQEIDLPDAPVEGVLYGVWGSGSQVFAVGHTSWSPAILHYVPE